MNDYVLLTDSSCDLPAGLTDELCIEVSPLSIALGGKTYKNYLDWREIEPKVFYDKLRNGENASTSAVNVGEFVDLFEKNLSKGIDVLCISFSSGLSATYSSAFTAAEELSQKYPERKVYVVDSLCASMGQGLLVYLAAKRKKAGADIDTVRNYAEEIKLQIAHWFTVDSLAHLKRGGRISGATALIGSLLSIKPVMHVDNAGTLQPVSKVRGRQNSLETLLKNMEEAAVDLSDQVVFISHGDCLSEIEPIEAKMRERFNVKDVVFSYVGPVIGAHSGPGTVAIFFLAKER